MHHLFGVTVDTGDYGHLTIDHSAMLLGLHRSLAKYSTKALKLHTRCTELFTQGQPVMIKEGLHSPVSWLFITF